ncbi:MAG: hypothetical protein K2K56_08670 [Lachnospiraceae bacterium]|nr:hypothetical protein [Lachnospiraceae bacterium]
MLLEERYNELIAEYGFETENDGANVNGMLRDVLAAFAHGCEKPAIWCYGEHTRMLMADFINELKQVKFIVDEHAEKYSEDSGFKVIHSQEVGLYGIDGVIISSFKYRNEIRTLIEKEYPSMKCLDIYDYFEKNGVILRKEYYLFSHPYRKYAKINGLKTLLTKECNAEKKENLFLELIKSFVEIKDFLLATECAEALCAFVNSEKYFKLCRQLKELYEMECKAVEQIDENNVLMLCLDGMRNKDISGEDMSEFQTFIQNRCYRYENAYAVSTSTYESLIPAYGEISDMRTRYYEKNCVSESECRFIQTARQQKRNIYFYTDFVKYVDAEGITRKESYETVTEKLWNFILDAADEKNGLFYVHVLYESHYSYPNPYIMEGFIAEGTSILFDFLTRNGGKIRTDYEGQHRNAMRYLNDVLMPFLERMKFRMLIYADHGNVIFDQDMTLEEIPSLCLTYHDDLLHIPLIIKSPETGIGVNNINISLMEINEILICLMEKRKFTPKLPDIVKAQRSAIYNPDFHYLYQKCGQEQGLRAYEVFLFEDRTRLAIYDNGYTELVENDHIVEDEQKKRCLYERIKTRISVCECDKVSF